MLINGRRPHLEGVWICEVGGHGEADPHPDVTELRGHVAERQVADHHVLGVVDLQHWCGLPGRPRQLHVQKHGKEILFKCFSWIYFIIFCSKYHFSVQYLTFYVEYFSAHLISFCPSLRCYVTDHICYYFDITLLLWLKWEDFLRHIIINVTSLGFGLSVEQNKTFEDVILGSDGHFVRIFFSIN